MFHGSVPPDMRSIIAERVRGWSVPALYIGCSGNFTVERAVAAVRPDLALHGNDVTIYSSALGFWLAGQDVPITLRPQWQGDYGYIADSLDTPIDRAASVLVASRLALAVGRVNPYYDRLRRAFAEQWPALQHATVTRLERSALRLTSYAAEDVLTWIERVPVEAGLVAYPPFFANDYSNQFAQLDELFDWPAPAYQEIGDDELAALFAALTERRHWMFGSNQRWPAYEAMLRAVTQTTNRGLPIYVYASDGPARVVAPRQETAPVLAPRLGLHERLGERLQLVPISAEQFATLRSQYMNAHIRPGMAQLAVAVLVDGVLVGCYALITASGTVNFDSRISGPRAYLLSDFPVAPTDYSRLAKLVLYAAASAESQLLIQRAFNRRIRALVTTAFSDHPVSMKYRGIFRLLTRRENEADLRGWDGRRSDAPMYGNRYQLNYGIELGRWTLAEGLSEWRQRHGQLREDA